MRLLEIAVKTCNYTSNCTHERHALCVQHTAHASRKKSIIILMLWSVRRLAVAVNCSVVILADNPARQKDCVMNTDKCER